MYSKIYCLLLSYLIPYISMGNPSVFSNENHERFTLSIQFSAGRAFQRINKNTGIYQANKNDYQIPGFNCVINKSAVYGLGLDAEWKLKNSFSWATNLGYNHWITDVDLTFPGIYSYKRKHYQTYNVFNISPIGITYKWPLRRNVHHFFTTGALLGVLIDSHKGESYSIRYNPLSGEEKETRETESNYLSLYDACLTLRAGYCLKGEGRFFYRMGLEYTYSILSHFVSNANYSIETYNVPTPIPLSLDLLKLNIGVAMVF